MRAPLNNVRFIKNQTKLKVRTSYGPLAYFSDIFISGKNFIISQQKILQRYVNLGLGYDFGPEEFGPGAQ